MRFLELLIPPPLVAASMALVAWGVQKAVPALDVPLGGFHQAWVAGFLALAAVGIDLSALFAFRRAQTTINPLRPEKASQLVTGGIYRISRNPMYLGMLLLLAAVVIWLANAGSAVVLPAFVAYMNRFQIGPEERALTARFGDEFAAFMSRTRRWI